MLGQTFITTPHPPCCACFRAAAARRRGACRGPLEICSPFCAALGPGDLDLAPNLPSSQPRLTLHASLLTMPADSCARPAPLTCIQSSCLCVYCVSVCVCARANLSELPSTPLPPHPTLVLAELNFTPTESTSRRRSTSGFDSSAMSTLKLQVPPAPPVPFLQRMSRRAVPHHGVMSAEMAPARETRKPGCAPPRCEMSAATAGGAGMARGEEGACDEGRVGAVAIREPLQPQDSLELPPRL